MKKFISLIIFSCTVTLNLLSAPPARAEAKLKDVISTVEQSYNSLADLQASFSQKTFVASVKREQKGNGTLSIKKNSKGPAMFRFDYTKPQQLIVSDGSTVWYYLPENRQVMVSDLKSLLEGGQGVTLNYLTGIGRISRDFAIKPFNGGRDAKGNYLLELIPKTPSRNLAKLEMTVSSEDVGIFLKKGKIRNTFPILTSVIYDQLGTRTTIDFSKVRVNRGLPASLFQFKVPAGVEVLRH
ncbi:MAG: outer membrane lipoprotein carrier protein LolA [Geobacteraceae bacterium]|nr:outer membrane lipoprotein carrier protein LolA [Geobacteraceae bacterium]